MHVHVLYIIIVYAAISSSKSLIPVILFTIVKLYDMVNYSELLLFLSYEKFWKSNRCYVLYASLFSSFQKSEVVKWRT